jgi:prepilin-type N-terminal cleavage/methylation domain-containing protein
MQQPTNRSGACKISGFTLLEILIVVIIIGLLISLVIPIVGRVRTAARTANTQALISQLSGACDRYYSDFHSYPGPFSNDQIGNSGGGGEVDPADTAGAIFANSASTSLPFPTAASTTYDQSATDAPKFSQMSMGENLVLGLLGGLVVDSTGTPPTLRYDPSQVGNGPMSLNTNQPKRFSPYLETTPDLSWNTIVVGAATLKTGHFRDSNGTEANDTVIPEFVDRYTDPLPILYMRAKVGYTTITSPASSFTITDNPVITNIPSVGFPPPPPPPTGNPRSQYDRSQIISYTGTYSGTWPGSMNEVTATPPASGSSIGVGKSLNSSLFFYQNNQVTPANGLYHGLRTVDPTANGLKINGAGQPTTKYQYPYDCFPYFLNDFNTHSPKAKDSYILISAGPDRIYGTSDDITTFGSVTPGQ